MAFCPLGHLQELGILGGELSSPMGRLACSLEGEQLLNQAFVQVWLENTDQSHFDIRVESRRIPIYAANECKFLTPHPHPPI
jgi:hypothetical protein